MKTFFVVTAALTLLCLGGIAQANVFNMGPGLTNLETVPVGDPGNTGELSGSGNYETTCGSVGYNYNIGKYEVTAGQYTDFLNNKAKSDPYGLYSSNMDGDINYFYGCRIQRSGPSGSYSYSVASGWANRPVNYISYWDACRFANWLGNGQGNGDTETGAYTLNGYNGDDGGTIQRNAGATWAVTSEDEWYKAAYYDPNKPGGAGYWLYPTKSDTAPANQVLSTDPGNSANYFINNYSIGIPYYRTNAGEFENSGSAYGTFDQGGNVWEWNEATVYQQPSGYACRGQRGGSFYNQGLSLQASDRVICYPTKEGYGFGFRVSEVVPEPASIIAMLGGLVGLLGMRRRRSLAP